MISIYLHIPFCDRKCFYCDFYSIENKKNIDIFVDDICTEIDLQTQYLDINNEDVGTVFFGGGTPSLLNANQLERIISKLHSNYNILPNAEWTLEANPKTFDLNLLKSYKSLGINRLSIGIQSFNDDELKFLQRTHSSVEAIQSVNIAILAGFDNLNLDIIFSIPNQTIKKIENTIKTLLKLNPEHISAYSLIYEPGTPLHQFYKSGKINKIDDDNDADIYEYICNELKYYGYIHYEVSNFAKPGYKCQHNLNYWNRSNYIGFGPSAHSFINNKRFWNSRSLNNYHNKLKKGKVPTKKSEMIDFQTQIEEDIMLNLRAGTINFDYFQKQYNFDMNSKFKILFKDWEHNNLAILKTNFISLTDKGYFLSNNLTIQLLKHI